MNILPATYQTAFKSLLLSISLLAFSLIVQGQNWTQYDQGTPPQHAAGVSPIGSYVSADLGVINLSNGSLSISLPMGTSGGRGFTMPISLNYSSKVWSLAHESVYDPVHQIDKMSVYSSYGAEGTYSDIYQRLAPGWTVSGVPSLKVQSVSINPCSSNGLPLYSLTKVSVVLPDRCEIELRDDQTDGAPLYIGCVVATPYRGSRWHATNGSGAIFISETDNVLVPGTLVTGDGMRYHFVNSVGPGGASARCDLITDRNGNQISITYSYVVSTGHLETDFIDQLGRTTKIEENAPDPGNSSIILPLLVTLKGYQNTTQYYKVKTDLLSSHIRADYGYNSQPIVTGNKDTFGYCYGGGQPPAENYLFPGSYCESQERIDNQKQVSQVVLPDGRTLLFTYNLFGELAEVVLPTGGKLQYDYSGVGSGFPAGNTLSMEYQTAVNQILNFDRAVTERRTYPNGSTLEGSWTYSYAPQTVNGTTYACAEMKAFDGSGTLLSDQRHFFLPSGRYLSGGVGTVSGTGYSLWSTGIEWRIELLNASTQVIAATEQDWLQRTAVSWSSGYTQEQPANENRVSETRRYMDNGSFTKSDTFYDNINYPRANNVIEVKEYDYDGSPRRRSTTTYVTGNYQTDDSIHLIGLPLQQSVWASDFITEKTRTVNEYDVYADDGNHYYQQDYASVTGHSASYGVSKVTRGNLTAVGHWLNTNNTTLYSYLRYDILGNPVANKDANGKLTTLSYADDFGDGSSPGGTTIGTYGATYALPTRLTSPPPNTGESAHVAYSQYDFSTGLLTGFKDRNSVITQSIYNDPLNRLTQIKSGLGLSGFETHTAIYYAPATTPFGITLDKNDVLTAKDQITLDDKVLRAWTVTDGFGRTTESWTKDPLGDDKIKVLYDCLGRVKQKSNPYRPSQGEVDVYTTTAYDLAGRVTSVTTPDSAAVNTSYSANTATVTDQTNKARKSVSDALGRVVQVYEDSAGLNYFTQYAYDELDNLTTVTQGAQPSRNFTYNSLKRLTSTFNPESGTTTYDYDNNSNLLHKTDARSITTTISYDALNRPISKSYNDNPQTAAVNYFYDSQTPAGAPNFSHGPSRGRLVAVTYAGASTGNYSGYDAMGHAALKIQRTGSVDYQMTAIYDLAGEMTSELYPSNRTMSFVYDSAGRTTSVAGNLGDGGATRNYSTGIIYSALGGMTKEQFGTDTPVYNKLFYNVRGQLAEIRASTSYTGLNDTNWNRGAIINHYSSQCWGMCGGSNSITPMTDNNGNLRDQDVYIPNSSGGTAATWRDHYEYDALNRSTQVHELTGNTPLDWQQEYLYDQWGNRRVNQTTTYGAGIPKPNFTVNSSNNRLSPPSGFNMGYDNAGNLTNDTYTGEGDRLYDAENRMYKAWANSQWQIYSYDGSGQRMKRNVSGIETWQVYGLGGELVAEYPMNGVSGAPQKEYGYRNGQLLITVAAQSQSTQNVSWTNLVGVAASGNSLTKTGGNGWNGGAVSTQAISSGDGYADFTANSLDYGMYGLSNGDTDQGYPDIDYAFYTERAEGRVYVYENGTNRGQVGTWVSGDRFRVAIEGGVVKYRKNGTLLYTSTVSPSSKYPLLVDTSLYSGGNTLSNVVLSGNLSGVSGLEFNWLVVDQLGTPRMVFDQTGSLANTKRHDYLPFGEELAANQGLRTAALGYNSDGLRKKFTQKERDLETGLDYFGARYYASAQGRFTSADQPFADQSRDDPQSWNLYTYVRNKPLAFTDPNGRSAIGDSQWWKEFWQKEVNSRRGLGRRTDAEVRKDTEERRRYLKQKEAEAGGCLAFRRNGGPWFIFNTDDQDPQHIQMMYQTIILVEMGVIELKHLSPDVPLLPSLSQDKSPEVPDSLTKAEKRKLGGLVNRATEKVSDVIRARGGSGANVREAGEWAEKTLGEAAKAATEGNTNAETAIKIAKQAGRLGQKH